MAFNLFDFSNVQPGTTSDSGLNPFASSVGSSVAPKTVFPFVPGFEPKKPETIKAISDNAELTPEEVLAMDSDIGLTDQEMAEMDADLSKLESEMPKEPGLLSNIGKRATERFGKALDVAGSDFSRPSQILQTGGQAAGFIGDILGEAMVSAYKTAGEPGKETAKELLKTDMGQSALSAISEGAEAYGSFKKQNPEFAGNLEAVVNIGSLLPIGAGAKAAAPIVGKGAKVAGKLALKPVELSGTALKKTGEALYKTALKPSTKEAEMILRAKAGLGAKPMTVADTALKSGIAGTETRIGVQALKKADDIFKKQVNPLIEKSTTQHNLKDLFKKAATKIDDMKEGELRKSELKEGLEALKEEYKAIGTSKFTTKTLQQEKSSLDKFTPDKVFKGKPIASSYNEAKNILANVFRSEVHADLGKYGLKSQEAFRDWANLQELSKVGIKGLTEGGLKGGFGGFWTTLYDQATIPLKTIGGQVLYRVGDKLEFIGPKGIKKIGDYLQGKVVVGKNGLLNANQAQNVGNTINSGIKNVSGTPKPVLKPLPLKPAGNAKNPTQSLKSKGGFAVLPKVGKTEIEPINNPIRRYSGEQGNFKDSLEKYSKELKTLDVYENESSIFLNRIHVKEQGKGVGSKVMKEITDYADNTGKRIELTPEKIANTSKSDLIDFYKRFGFVENKGKNKDFSTRELMYRDPKKPGN